MTIVTTLPCGAIVFGAGLVEITLPTGTESDGWFSVLTTKPFWPSWFAAVVASSPSTLVTNTGGGPDEMTRSTAKLRPTDVPEGGTVRMTAPTGTVLLGVRMTLPRFRPRCVRIRVASATDAPARSG